MKVHETEEEEMIRDQFIMRQNWRMGFYQEEYARQMCPDNFRVGYSRFSALGFSSKRGRKAVNTRSW